MDHAALFWISGLVAGTSYLARIYHTEFAFGVPFHLACIALLFSGLLLLLVGTLSARYSTNSPPAPTDAYIPLHSPTPHSTKKPGSPSLQASFKPSYDPHTSYHPRNVLLHSRRRLSLAFFILVVAIILRLESARWVLNHTNCARRGVASLLPLILVVYDAFTTKPNFIPPCTDRRLSAQIYWNLTRGRWRNIVPAGLLTLGAALIVDLLPVQRSTYICPLAGWTIAIVPKLQLLGTCLDIVIAVLIDLLMSRGREHGSISPVKKLADIGWVALVVYSLFAITGLAAMQIFHMNRYWFTQMPKIHILSCLKLSSAFAFTITCALQTNRRIGLSSTMFLSFFVAINAVSFFTSFDRSLVPTTAFGMIAALALLYLGLVAYLVIEASHNSRSGTRSQLLTKVPRRVMLVLLVLFCIQSVLWIARPTVRHTGHPVDSLIASAESRHREWLSKSSNSTTVSEAAKAYRKRYGGRDPPPRFDKWFQYARERQSLIVDDFDRMMDDLLPFWSLSPGDIRLRTWESISNPWNNVGGLVIRKGKVTISHPHVPESHAWMMRGIQKMIERFSRWLPDMDLAFNLNDEPRSAVYWDEMAGRVWVARNMKQVPPRDTGDFEADRSWIPIPGMPLDFSRFREAAFHPSFYRYGSVGCHKSMQARHDRHWNLGSTCHDCAQLHSLGHFVSDWRLAAAPCHQPDLADSYGLHLSPAAFRPTNELMPIFSQSKADGYSDILYPSAWNYVDRVAYKPNATFTDPNFSQKDNSLFWRGSTTEGYSHGKGAWQGMARQRFTHMINNATDDQQPLVLLPEQSLLASQGPLTNKTTWTYQYQAPSSLRAQFSTAVKIVGKIARCYWHDCSSQFAEFQPDTGPPVDFQAHWRHKYLFDLDGAGFSGRFLAFLQSKSLPLKVSLMREWWDSRVTPWVHFVPVDIRLREVWSLMAYFAGWREHEGAPYLVEPHDAEAEKIAMAGREWAGKVLRKEDMEIYMFRLLLEWGRLTDERRDELGWSADKYRLQS